MYKDHLEILGRMRMSTSPEANDGWPVAEVNVDAVGADSCLDGGPEEEDVEDRMRTGTTANSTTVNALPPSLASELFQNWTSACWS
jgi:hypothetical protein